MTAPYDGVPSSLVKGDSLVLHFTDPAYPPADGWWLAFALAGPIQTSLGVSLDGAGTGWDVVLTATSSADDLVVGPYTYAIHQENVTLDRRTTVQSGFLDVVASPADLPVPSDVRSFARRKLDSLEDAILRLGAVTSFSVDGRSYQYESHAELLAARARLRAEVADEEEAAAIARGESSSRTAWVQF